MKELYEKVGLFYLGKDIGDVEDRLTLIKNKWLTTHALIVGMTGSGKTGLGISLIEEAAIDNIPAVVIDPKGDMANLCLTDPSFDPDTFLPWIVREAEEKGVDARRLAEETAKRWKEGIESWHQDAERVARFHRVEKIVYTPGSSVGVPVNVLSSLGVPSSEILDDADTFASYLKSTVTSILSLIGETVDSVDSPAYILTAKIIRDAWRRGDDVTLERLIAAIIVPPFKKIGVLPLERFFPQKARMKLANRFNALLASPGFERWMDGEVLDMQRMLYDEEGKARIAIFSIAHLNDDERMFFVTLLLNRYIAWMRRQSGTSRLRAMLYMDEIFGFFPPNANPPSKEPMLLLLKQARAFGTGIVLSTQNPVDLDYKGLSNIGTWFVGRLQTKQDIARIIDGMESSAENALPKEEIAKALTGLEKRVFFLKSAHMERVKRFTTRWVMSYLKGPLDREELRRLTAPYRQMSMTDDKEEVRRNPSTDRFLAEPLDVTIPVYYEPPLALPVSYEPTLSASVTVRFFSQRRGVDERKQVVLILPLHTEMRHIAWKEAEESDETFEDYLAEPPSDAQLGEVPDIVRRDKGLRRAVRELKEYVYATQRLEMWRCQKLRMASEAGESRKDFLVRVEDALQEKKEAEIEKLQERYAKKERTLQERIARAQARVEKEKSDATSSLIDTGIAILGALFGKTSPTKIGRTLSKGTKVLKEKGDISRAQERLESLLVQMQKLEEELEAKLDALEERFAMENYPVEPLYVTPRKNDIDVDVFGVVWRIY